MYGPARFPNVRTGPIPCETAGFHLLLVSVSSIVLSPCLLVCDPRARPHCHLLSTTCFESAVLSCPLFRVSFITHQHGMSRERGSYSRPAHESEDMFREARSCHARPAAGDTRAGPQHTTGKTRQRAPASRSARNEPALEGPRVLGPRTGSAHGCAIRGRPAYGFKGLSTQKSESRPVTVGPSGTIQPMAWPRGSSTQR